MVAPKTIDVLEDTRNIKAVRHIVQTAIEEKAIYLSDIVIN